jgi:hypothetical protein
MSVQRRDLVRLAHPAENVVGLLERIVQRGEALDELGSALAEVGELVDAQLPR